MLLLLLLRFLVKIEEKYPLSISAYALSSVIFSPSLVSSRPVLPFDALLLFVYLTLFLTPFTTFTNQYLILCLCLFWFCPFMSSYSHLLTPVFLLIPFLWLPFHSHAFQKPLVQAQYINLLPFHILGLSKSICCCTLSFLLFTSFTKASSGFFHGFLHPKAPRSPVQLQGGVGKHCLMTLFRVHGRAGIIWKMHNLIRIVRVV